jgi:cell division protein FtsB
VKNFKRILSFFKNKYVITLAILAGWLLFFDKNDIFSQFERKQEVNKLEAEVNYFRTEIANNKREEAELKSNPRLLEKFAREHYLMKKDSEDIFVLVEDTLEKR